MRVFGVQTATVLAALGCCLWVTTSSDAARAEDREATSEMTVSR
jgi:hypothetical protein